MKNSANYARNIFTAVALAGAGVLAGLSWARATGPMAINPANTPAPAGDTTAAPKMTRAKQVEVFLASLNLPDDQKTQIKAILKDEQAKRKETQEDTSLAQKEKRAKNKDIRDAADAKIKGILTPDQYVKWQAFQKQQNARQGTGKAPLPTTPDAVKAQQ